MHLSSQEVGIENLLKLIPNKPPFCTCGKTSNFFVSKQLEIAHMGSIYP
jgi:hypothetical protein